MATTGYIIDEDGFKLIIDGLFSGLEIQAPAAAAGTLTLSTAELTVVDGDKLGQIDFQAPLEDSGTDAVVVGASIWAEADDTFAVDNNSTELVFATATSGVVVEAMRIDKNGNVGIGTTSPSHTLDVAGNVQLTGLLINIVAKTAAYTATATDDVITCGVGNETFAIDLPAVAAKKLYWIKNVGTGVITVDADTTGSTTIDGQATQQLAQYDTMMVIADASVYHII